MYDIQHCFICRPSDSTVCKIRRTVPNLARKYFTVKDIHVCYLAKVFNFYTQFWTVSFNPNWCKGKFKRTYLFWESKVHGGKNLREKISIFMDSRLITVFTHIRSSWHDLGLYKSQTSKGVGLKGPIGNGHPSPVVKSFILQYFCKKRIAMLRSA